MYFLGYLPFVVFSYIMYSMIYPPKAILNNVVLNYLP